MNEISIEKKAKDLASLLEITKELISHRDIDSILDAIMREAAGILDADRFTVYLYDPRRNELWTRVAQDLEISEFRMPAGKGIAGHVAETKKILNIKDAYADPRFNPDIDSVTNYITRTVLCIPMVSKGDKLIGVIQVLNKRQGVFTEYDESILALFCAVAAQSIENARYHEESERAFISFVSTLAETVDAKSPVTSGHSRRVSRYAVNIAKAMGYKDDDLKVVEYAATLHDIGKISIPDSILQKNEKLTDEEYGIIKSHSSYTKKILEKVYYKDEMRDIPRIASGHHEKVDGSGYPEGLKGDNISLMSKILAVSDVYDSLTAFDRPYRQAVTTEEAIAFLESEKGRSFDGRVVDVFVEKRLYRADITYAKRISSELYIEYSVMKEDVLPASIDKYRRNDDGRRFVFSELHRLEKGNFLDINLFFPDVILRLLGEVAGVEPIESEKCYRVFARFLNMGKLAEDKLSHYMIGKNKT